MSKALGKGTRSLEAVGANVLGTVMNNIEKSRPVATATSASRDPVDVKDKSVASFVAWSYGMLPRLHGLEILKDAVHQATLRSKRLAGSNILGKVMNNVKMGTVGYTYEQ